MERYVGSITHYIDQVCRLRYIPAKQLTMLIQDGQVSKYRLCMPQVIQQPVVSFNIC